MNKKWIALFTIICIMLTGCQLAQPESPVESVGNDRLIGVLVSGGHFGTESDGDAIHTLENEGKRIYASAKGDGYYEFPEELGWWIMAYRVETEHESYGTCDLSPEIHSTLMHYKVIIDVSAVEVAGEIYVADSATDLALYVNPVYQTAAGEVYVLGTAPLGYQGATMDGCSVSYRDQIQGLEEDQVSTAEMTIRVIRLAECYRILQMDSENRVIRADEYRPEEMPDELTPEDGCSYIILESVEADGTVERFVYNPGDGDRRLETYYPQENGLCVRGNTLIRWEETA